MLAASTALALVFSASAAGAVTPEEVWQNWQAFSASAGQDLTTGSTTLEGGTLTVTDVTVTIKDDLGGSLTSEVGDLVFTDNGDGTVAVTVPDSYPIMLAFPPSEDGPASISLMVSQPGLAITAGGSATETSYDFDAPAISVVVTEVKDKSGAVLDTKGDVSLTNVTASYKIAQAGEALAVDVSFGADGMVLNLSGSDTEGPGKGDISLSMAGLSSSTTGNLLKAEVMENMVNALNAGFAVDTRFSFGGMTFNADITDESGQSKLGAQATGGRFALIVDKSQVNYGSSLSGANFTVSGDQIPFPVVTSTFGELAFDVLMPASKSEEPQDFAFVTRLVDFTISDEVWGLFDPAGTLSRDPATFILSTKGTGRWLVDIMDPAYQVEGVEPPGELNSLELQQLTVRAAGAEVNAAGALTFDNSDLVTFGGMPRPDGSINVTIKGVNQLIDNLIAMGVLPDDQAMGFRMMLGMFTRPGSGGDEVISLIEFKDGGLFANGQQLQ
jgi:hypothetical protein